MCAQRTDPIDDGKEASTDDLKILVFHGARIKTKVPPYDRPDGLQVQLGWHVEAALGDINPADALQNIARRGATSGGETVIVGYDEDGSAIYSSAPSPTPPARAAW